MVVERLGLTSLIAENVEPTALTLLATADAIAAALVLSGDNPFAARTILVRGVVASIFVPAMSQRMTPKTPTTYIVGWSFPPVVFMSQ